MGKLLNVFSLNGSIVARPLVLLFDFAFVGRPSLKFEKPGLTPPSLCEGRFAGPLQYRAWKSMKGSLYPGI